MVLGAELNFLYNKQINAFIAKHKNNADEAGSGSKKAKIRFKKLKVLFAKQRPSSHQKPKISNLSQLLNKKQQNKK